MSSISSGTTLTTALVQTADTSGVLQLQTNGTTTAVTIDTNQNVGVGVTPSAWTSAFKALQVGAKGSLAYYNGTTYLSENFYNDGTSAKYLTTDYASQYNQTGGQHQWFTAPSSTAGNAITFTQAMTLDASSNLLLGITSYSAQNANYIALQTSGGNLVTAHASGTPSGYQYAAYLYNAGVIGSITQNGTTGVLYNLTSDYRLKNNQEDLTGAKDFIMALKPKKWQWWDGSGEGVGFVAHEFMEVAKYSGHGEKDAVDADGKPVYQSIQPSSSEVMANLVSFIQEQQTLIESLTTRLAALEAK